jgi:hypothetical protein
MSVFILFYAVLCGRYRSCDGLISRPWSLPAVHRITKLLERLPGTNNTYTALGHAKMALNTGSKHVEREWTHLLL